MKTSTDSTATKRDRPKHSVLSVVSMLKAREVWDEQEARKEQRMAAMRPVLGQLHAQIRRQAIHAPNAPYVVYEVPSYVFGYPIYQFSEARDYLMDSLQKSGFLVWVVDEKYLLVSWVKTQGGRSGSYRPPLITNYRPQVYDPHSLGSMLR
jgi:hypothetical protein